MLPEASRNAEVSSYVAVSRAVRLGGWWLPASYSQYCGVLEIHRRDPSAQRDSGDYESEGCQDINPKHPEQGHISLILDTRHELYSQAPLSVTLRNCLKIYALWA